MRVSECVCVSEEGGREGGGGGADTELKTKTPHVNVGNNLWNFTKRHNTKINPAEKSYQNPHVFPFLAVQVPA